MIPIKITLAVNYTCMLNAFTNWRFEITWYLNNKTINTIWFYHLLKAASFNLYSNCLNIKQFSVRQFCNSVTGYGNVMSKGTIISMSTWNEFTFLFSAKMITMNECLIYSLIFVCSNSDDDKLRIIFRAIYKTILMI